jgi:hypothetical protein
LPSGLIAAKQRSAQQGDSAIEKAATELIHLIDKPKSAAGRPERKAFVFEYKFVDEGSAPGSFEGYGSVFNNGDDGGDLIQPAAFAGVIQRHQTNGTMLKSSSITVAWAAGCSAAPIRWPTCRSAPGTR